MKNLNPMNCPRCRSKNPETSKFCGSCGILLQQDLSSDKPITEDPAGKKSPIPQGKSRHATQTLRSVMRDLTIGSTFSGRYQVLEELGRGGMGKVYKVLDNKVNERVALKLLNLDVRADQETITRFQNELKLARKISHRNVCRMYDLGEAEDVPFITMEYVSGEDLKSLVRRAGHLSVGKAVFIALQVCEGLAEAHRLGVIHRDLKPHNIMVDREGNAKIMDFGIARSLGAKGITTTGIIMGTPEYMSPEQVDGKEVDQRTDIYALGTILYEMLTGRAPFEGETPLSVAVKQKTAVPADPRKFNPQIHIDLTQVIFKCLNKDARKRYQTVEELLSDLKAVEKEVPTTGKVKPFKEPITSKEITLKLSAKKMIKPALFAAAAVALVLVLWRLIPSKKAVPLSAGKPSLAVMYFENNTGDPSFEHWRKALSDLLISDLSQSQYISVLSGEKLFHILEDLDLLQSQNYSSEDLKKVAERGGVDNILVGKLAMAGTTFRISTLLQKADTGELIGSVRVEGEGESSIFNMVDDLTRRIKQNFRLSSAEIAGDIDKDAGVITTASPEAYRYYSEGIKFQNQGEYSKSIPLLETATALDPEFAMAFRSLAVAYESLGYGTEAKEKLKSALETAKKVSERERYSIQADFYRQSQETYDKAIEAYEKLLKLYPEDIIGNNNLGVIYMNRAQWDEAIARFEAAIRSQPDSIFPYGNLARSLNAKGLYSRSDEILQDCRTRFPDSSLLHHYMARNALIQGRFDIAEEETNTSFSLNPTSYFAPMNRGDIHLYQGRFTQAEREYSKLFETQEPRAHQDGFQRLAALFLLQGRYPEAKNQVQQGIELTEMLNERGLESRFFWFLAYLHFRSGESPNALAACERSLEIARESGRPDLKRRAWNLKGMVFADMNNLVEARIQLENLESSLKKDSNEPDIRLAHHLQGLILLRENDTAAAVKKMVETVSLLPSQSSDEDEHALYHGALAEAYFRNGDFDKAQREYEKITALTTGRLLYGDIYANSFFRLGKIYQKNGEKAKAAESFQKFLQLRQESMPDSVEVREALKQLS